MSDASATDEERSAAETPSASDGQSGVERPPESNRPPASDRPPAADRDGSADESNGQADNANGTDDDSLTGVHPTAVDREFGTRGWILVGVIVLAFVVAPIAVMLVPPGGEGYLFALVLLPLIPAVVLAAAAVWATTRP